MPSARVTQVLASNQYVTSSAYGNADLFAARFEKKAGKPDAGKGAKDTLVSSASPTR